MIRELLCDFIAIAALFAALWIGLVFASLPTPEIIINPTEVSQ